MQLDSNAARGAQALEYDSFHQLQEFLPIFKVIERERDFVCRHVRIPTSARILVIARRDVAVLIELESGTWNDVRAGCESANALRIFFAALRVPFPAEDLGIEELDRACSLRRAVFQLDNDSSPSFVAGTM